MLDFGATVSGYCSDVTRTVVVGQADARQREVHAAVHAANEAAREDFGLVAMRLKQSQCFVDALRPE